MPAKPRQPLIQLRAGQRASFRHPAGILGLICRRQYGKSYRLGAEAIDVMLGTPGITCVFMSAALRLGQENLRKQAEVWRDFVARLREAGLECTTNADDDQGRMLDPDAVADMIEASKLEVRIWHDRTTYSRSLVIAANPDTAVGFTGWLFLDEVGRMPNFRDVWEAAEPFAAANPDFRIRLATTPPPDDSHHSYEILAPPADQDFPVNPEGNWYRSAAGILIHRVDAWDAAADGIPLYHPDTRKPISPEEHRALQWDKTAWDRNFGCRFLRNTGQAAISGVDLDHAQARGRDEGLAIALYDTLPPAGPELETFLRSYLPPDWTKLIGSGRVGLGLDLATSDKATANPSSLTVTELRGDLYTRLVLAFKSRDESITRALVELIIGDLVATGKKPRGLAIDASNEVFFAQAIRRALLGKLRVLMVKGGEKISYRGEDVAAKIVLGNLYANAFADGRVTLPADRWLAEDHRLVRRVGGSFEAAVLPDGRHADTFDSGKLAQWVVEGTVSGPVEAAAVSVGESLGTPGPPRPGIRNPFARFFDRGKRRLNA